MGKSAIQAAIEGTREVTLAVIATTLTVVAVFGPLGFLSGVVGQFFKQFDLTVVFAMLSAYFAGKSHGSIDDGPWPYRYTSGVLLRAFDRMQNFLEFAYEKTDMRSTETEEPVPPTSTEAGDSA